MTNINKVIIGAVVVIILVGVGSFYGGMRYTQSKSSARFSQEEFQNFRNLSPEDRQQRFQGMAANGGLRAGRMGGLAGSDFIAGEVISKDEKSVTIKLRDGGSKIIFYSETTAISKSVNGSSSDLEAGKQIIASGKSNQDGSITAQTIQLPK